MSFRFTKGIFKICVAQICQNIGWHAVQTSPMDILIDVLHRYLLEVSKTVHTYSNQYGRTEPNLDDVALTLKDFGVSLSEIEEYVSNVEPVPFVHKLPAVPLEHLSKLHHPKPGSRELLHRPEYIFDHLPLMRPEFEEDRLLSPTFDSGLKKNLMDSSGAGEGGSPSPLSSPKHGTKRSTDWSNDMPATKKPRLFVEEEGRPMREVTSVFMTPSGFISPAREGKTAEPTLPHTIDSPPSTPEPPMHTSDGTGSRKDSKSKDSKRDKTLKSKKEKEISKKDSKKAKTSKKENKENTALASEKYGSTSFSGKKDHSSSHKSSGKSDKGAKSSDMSRQKIRNDKTKFKEGKEDHKKSREHLKFGKSKSKLKHGSSSFSKSTKQSKFFKSPQKYIAKSPKKATSKSPKREKKISVSPPTTVAVAKKADISASKVEMRRETRQELNAEESTVSDSNDREESPEPRLVIDISTDTQNKQERESRLAVFDECINAVIQRGQEESELEVEKFHKAVDKTIDEVVRGPVMQRSERKDIYEFTDSNLSELSSLSSLEPDFPLPVRKERSMSSDSERSTDSIKKRRVKNKQQKRNRDMKKSPGSVISPKNQKSPNVIVKREERSPSPIRLKDEIYSSDGSASSHSPSPPNFFDLPHSSQKHLPQTSLSETSPQQSSFAPSSVPSTSFSNSPFAPIRPLPCQIQSNPYFPTPPLFQTSKLDQGSMFQSGVTPQPLNLAKSAKSPPDAKNHEPYDLSSMKTEGVESKKIKSESLAEKGGRAKIHRKDKKEKEKFDKKERLKKKNKEKKEKEKEKPKVKENKETEVKPKERGRPKLEKSVKEEKKVKTAKSEKKKEKDEKVQEDSSLPKFTLKLSGGNSGSGKFFIKPSAKSSTSPPQSPFRKARTPSPLPARVATPSPPPSPPAPPVSSPPASPVPPHTPPHPPPVTDSEVPVADTVVQPATRATHSRGRGRGRKPAAQSALQAARTVITETLGTIVDESGNKIWICPACTRPDDGSPMIGCDECDDWYHWVCVGIVVPPKEEESWFCTRCISKRQSVPVKRRRKKHKKDK